MVNKNLLDQICHGSIRAQQLVGEIYHLGVDPGAEAQSPRPSHTHLTKGNVIKTNNKQESYHMYAVSLLTHVEPVSCGIICAMKFICSHRVETRRLEVDICRGSL